jgi:hypothetical protein
MFRDSESYLDGITEQDMEDILGGGWYISGSVNNQGIWVQFSWVWR